MLARATTEHHGDAGLAGPGAGHGPYGVRRARRGTSTRARPPRTGPAGRTRGVNTLAPCVPPPGPSTLGRPPHEPDQPFNTPITMASTYVAGGDLEYGRYANPTWTAFEDALGELEGGRCLSFASGLAAVATILDLVGNGQKVVAPRHAYNGSVMQLADLEARERVKSQLVDITDTDAVVAACEDASLVWIESPTNPAMEVADIPAITKAAHAGRGLRRRRQHLRDPPAAAAPGAGASTWSCTRRRSTSPATPTR